MKVCMVWGNMNSDRTDEQYPNVNICDECISLYSVGEDHKIISILEDYNSDYGNECYFCEKTYDEEKEENGDGEEEEEIHS